MNDYHHAVFLYSARNKNYGRNVKGKRQLLDEWLTAEAGNGFHFLAMASQPVSEDSGAHVVVLTSNEGVLSYGVTGETVNFDSDDSSKAR